MRHRAVASITPSSTFSPLDLPSLALWLDADDASSFTFSSGTVVSQWNDKSGNLRHMTQGTVSSQPTRSGTMNARTAVDFDGSNDWMTAGDVLDLGTSSITILTVFKSDALTTGRTLIGKYKATPADGSWLQVFQTSGTFVANSIYDAGTVATATSATWSSTTAHIFTTRIDRVAGTIEQYFDGTLDGTTSFTPDSGSSRNIATSLYLGALRNSADNAMQANFYFDGLISESVVCLAALGTTDRTNTEGYYRTKWGTP